MTKLTTDETLTGHNDERPYRLGDKIIIDGVGLCMVLQCWLGVGGYIVLAEGEKTASNRQGLYHWMADKVRMAATDECAAKPPEAGNGYDIVAAMDLGVTEAGHPDDGEDGRNAYRWPVGRGAPEAREIAAAVWGKYGAMANPFNGLRSTQEIVEFILSKARAPQPARPNANFVGCPECNRDVLREPAPATGFIAKCGRRLARLDQCASSDICTSALQAQP